MSAVSEEIREGIMDSGGKMISGMSEETSLKLRMLVAGGVSGAASKTCTAPLARLTILYQVAGFGKLGTTQPPRLGTALLQTVQREGVPALWKGNMATILHRLPYSAVAFWTYEESTSFLQQYFPKDTDTISGTTDVARRFISGGLAGMAGTAVAYPLDLVRTRLAAQTTHMYYSGIFNAMRTIVREEGALGMYKGLGGSLLQVAPNLALNFCAYETLKAYWMARHQDEASPNIAGSLVCGGLSGFVSSTATFPIDLVRRRMQLEGQQGLARRYTGYWHIVQDIFRTSGWRGFYSGIIPEYCKVMPGVAIVYTTFEFIKRNLRVDHYNAGQR